MHGSMLLTEPAQLSAGGSLDASLKVRILARYVRAVRLPTRVKVCCPILIRRAFEERANRFMPAFREAG